MKDVAFVALGSNLGARELLLADARKSIAQLPDTRILAATEVEETAPLGPVLQGPFLNQMIAIETELAPCSLLKELQRIEREAGRLRRERWGPRTLDLDIVLYDSQTADDAGLSVPHPEIGNRPFWQRQIMSLRQSVS
ncbi:MAG TPA: 2-amino-4-hydroxy-6-hydroxymethyldihydropteridine diphosphokinase [Gemmatimonadaceae bacterium]|nr:2-amino-4-hydroxy-6-hydroxymethyldihydropteridine diphosphokinase [Gemmatimonadaceae bacterium]